MNHAAKTYLNYLVATEFPEQAPAYVVAKNRDLLWLLFPLFGFYIFIDVINDRYKERFEGVKGI